MSFFDKYIFTYGQSIFNQVHAVVVAPQVFIHTNILQSNSKLVAHRGVNTHPNIQENTLAAFELAWQTTPHIEFDLRMTLDEEVVIHHDNDLQRLWGVPNKISETSFVDLKKLAPGLCTWHELVKAETLRQKAKSPESPSQEESTWFVEIKTEKDPVHLTRLLKVLKKLLSQLSENNSLKIKVVLISLSPEIMDRLKNELSQYDRFMVYLLNKENALNYIHKDLECGLLGWYFNIPNLDDKNLGVGFINHKSSFQYYQIQNQKRLSQNKSPVWIFSDRVDML